MRLRTVTLVTVAAGVAGATVWWRRRRGAERRDRRIQLGHSATGHRRSPGPGRTPPAVEITDRGGRHCVKRALGADI